jgi:hypothetical protein
MTSGREEMERLVGALAPHDEADDDIAHCRLLKYTYGKVNAQGICTSSRGCT